MAKHKLYSRSEIKDIKTIDLVSKDDVQLRNELLSEFDKKHNRTYASVYMKLWNMNKSNSVITHKIYNINKFNNTKNNIRTVGVNINELRLPIKSISINNKEIVIKY